MKTSKRIISSILAALILVSAMAVGSISTSAATLKAPKSFKVYNGIHGFGITWKKVSGAKKYELYKNGKFYKNISGKAVKSADFSIVGGTTYTYKLRAINGKKKGPFSSYKIVRVNKTIITSITNTDAGVKLKWAYRPGADTYTVERKTTGSYKKLGTTTKKVRNFTDKTAVAGTKYTYRITCYNKATKAYSAVSNVDKIIRLVAVTNVKAKKAVDNSRQVAISWTASKGAESYDVYRQAATDTAYKKIASAITTTSYTDKDIKNNPSAYRYYVVSRKGSYTSAKCAERIVQTYGVDPAWLDDNGDYHLPLTINVDETYDEGKYLVEYFSYDGTYDIEIADPSVVSVVDNTIIKGLKAGDTIVKISVPESIKANITDGLMKKLTSKTVYLEVKVR